MPLHLTIVGGGSNIQTLLERVRGGEKKTQTETDKTGETGEPNEPNDTDPVSVPLYLREPRRRQDIMNDLVRIEKRHWDKGSSWGEQLPTLVSKKNAYVFVLLGPEGPEADGEVAMTRPRVHPSVPASLHSPHNPPPDQLQRPIAYAIVYVNTLHAQLSKLFTMPAWRGRGVATHLVEMVLGAVGKLKKRAGYEVTLMVDTENRNAQAVYQRCGFQRDPTVVKDYYCLGRDAFRMVHVLR